jgi:hypothetical protein
VSRGQRRDVCTSPERARDEGRARRRPAAGGTPFTRRVPKSP